jgi:hypothetical protein
MIQSFTIENFKSFERATLLGWIDAFPKWAMQGSGFPDLTIFKEVER